MRDVLERIFIGLSEIFERIYYTRWGCKHGKHRMKFSGCMYCGAGGKQQPWFYVKGPRD